MSISVTSLSRKFGNQYAVKNISFEVQSEGVLGFLGPNGAGKTTTMKILTGALEPTEGTAEVCGYDVVDASIDARRQIGYLPENNPLYYDMYVLESLSMVAGFYQVESKKKRIEYLVELTGLGEEQHKKIGQLSKGYKQRVGLAQAMMHDPKVLILDEPTSGLDPNQLTEIRGLIKQIGLQKTVLFSTHIMQEVEALCDEVLIIHHGEIVTHTSFDTLSAQIQEESCVMVTFENVVDPDVLRNLEGINRVEVKTPHSLDLFSDMNTDIRKQVYQCSIRENWILLEMVRAEMKVEDVFQKLTK